MHKQQATSIPLHVLVVQEDHPGVADVKGAGGVGGQPHNHLALRIRQVGEFGGSGLPLLLQQIGCELLQEAPLLIWTEAVDLGHYLCRQGRYLPRPLAKSWLFRQYLPDHGLHLRPAAVEDGVVEGELPDQVLQRGGSMFGTV